MKKLLIILILFIPVLASAQRARVKNIPEHDHKAVHFGFTLGLNTMDFRVRDSEYAIENGFFGEVSGLTPGFNINIVSNFRLSDYFDFRMLPGVAFGQRRIDYYHTDGSPLPGSPEDEGSFDPRQDSRSQELESSFLEFPFILKYKSDRVNNYRPYLVGGVNFRYDLAKNYSETDEIFLSLNSFDIYLETGFGIDFYLPYFRFSTELKYAKGFLNVFNPRGESIYENSIDRLKSNLLVLSFHFE